MTRPASAGEAVLWEEPYPHEVHKLGGDQDWVALAERYCRRGATDELSLSSSTDRPLRRCLEVARLNAAQTAVIETRYIDADYRSEYATFYAKAFRSYPDSAHRVHFFKARLSPEDVWQLPEHPGYLGYMIVRPVVRGVVGRTLLAPPPDLAGAVRVLVREPVHFFGQDLEARGFPFTQQDARSGSCAHAAAWMAHYAMHHGDPRVERRTMAAFQRSR